MIKMEVLLFFPPGYKLIHYWHGNYFDIPMHIHFSFYSLISSDILDSFRIENEVPYRPYVDDYIRRLGYEVNDEIRRRYNDERWYCNFYKMIMFFEENQRANIEIIKKNIREKLNDVVVDFKFEYNVEYNNPEYGKYKIVKKRLIYERKDVSCYLDSERANYYIQDLRYRANKENYEHYHKYLDYLEFKIQHPFRNFRNPPKEDWQYENTVPYRRRFIAWEHMLTYFSRTTSGTIEAWVTQMSENTFERAFPFLHEIYADKLIDLTEGCSNEKRD